MAMKDGILTTENLNLIMLIDRSGSMEGERIDQVNQALAEMKRSLIQIADEENVSIKVRVITFSDNPEWIVGDTTAGVDVNDMQCPTIYADGWTKTDYAICEANNSLKKEYLGAHALRPVVILITDGGCTNPHGDYLAAIEQMKRKLAGNTGKEKVTRIAIGVQDYNEQELVEFASIGLYHDIEQPLVFGVQNVNEIRKVINFVAVSSMYSSIMDNQDVPVINDEEFV
ncbi:MAG: VWA domain-containing protein [Phascolarctobacterium sp.]|nr:VWA domain-containing protein [Phascolarctobacterium sp.]